ncbi:MAG: MBL fold metallo-hydrolase [Gemmatimonadota bacterium]
MRVASLGSGSRGNAFLIEAGPTRLLVDAGFSGASLARRLDALDVPPESVRAVVVTHEHRDHTAGIGVAARRWGWRLYMTRGTAGASRTLLAGSETVCEMVGDRPFPIGELEVFPFGTCHDAAEPVAVSVLERRTGCRVGVATDLGRATTPVRFGLQGCHFLILEANHDERLLRDGPYPWSIKQRIGGSRGHLSNRLAGELAAELCGPQLGGVLLAHLSRECNDPALAEATVAERLGRVGYEGQLATADQDTPGGLIPVSVPGPGGGRREPAQLGLFG